MARVIVGNAVAGDTLNECDVLDTGNGALLVAQILLGGRVQVRAGLYDLSLAGAPAIGAGIDPPANTQIIGAGNGLVTIASPAVGEQRLFNFSNKVLLQDLDLVLKSGNGTGTFAEFLRFFGSPTLVRVRALPIAGLLPATTSVRRVFNVVSGGSTSVFKDCSAGSTSQVWPSFQPATASDLFGFTTVVTTNVHARTLSGCEVHGTDVPYDLANALVSECQANSSGLQGFILRGDTKLDECVSQGFSGIGANGFFLESSHNTLVNCRSRGPTAPSTDEAVGYYFSTANHSAIIGCRSSNVEIGAQFDSAKNNQVLGCQLETGATDGVTDTDRAVLIETGSEFNHIDRCYLDGNIGIDVEGGASDTRIGTNSWGSAIDDKVFIVNIDNRVVQEVYTSLTDIKVANYTAASGELVLYDPSGGTFTFKTPHDPSGNFAAEHDAHFEIKNNTTDTTAITINPDGGGYGTTIENPATGLFVSSFTVGIPNFYGKWRHSRSTDIWYFVGSI
jgi:hypothetical protein